MQEHMLKHLQKHTLVHYTILDTTLVFILNNIQNIMLKFGRVHMKEHSVQHMKVLSLNNTLNNMKEHLLQTMLRIMLSNGHNPILDNTQDNLKDHLVVVHI